MIRRVAAVAFRVAGTTASGSPVVAAANLAAADVRHQAASHCQNWADTLKLGIT